jgi:hypothetical protein
MYTEESLPLLRPTVPLIAVCVSQRQLLIMDHSHIVYVWGRVELVYGVCVLNVTSVTMALYLLTALHMMSKT